MYFLRRRLSLQSIEPICHSPSRPLRAMTSCPSAATPWVDAIVLPSQPSIGGPSLVVDYLSTTGTFGRMGTFSCPSTTEGPVPVRSLTKQPTMQGNTHPAAFLRGTPTQ